MRQHCLCFRIIQQLLMTLVFRYLTAVLECFFGCEFDANLIKLLLFIRLLLDTYVQ